jgi:hypothetical protein
MKICQLRNIINSLVKEALAEPTTVPPPTKPAPVRQPTQPPSPKRPSPLQPTKPGIRPRPKALSHDVRLFIKSRKRVKEAIDVGNYPDFIDPTKRAAIENEADYVESILPDLGSNADRYLEIITSESYKKAVDRLAHYVGRPIAELEAQFPTLPSMLEVLMATATQIEDIERNRKSQLEKLALNLVLNLREYKYIKQLVQSGEIIIDLKLDVADLTNAIADDEMNQMMGNELTVAENLNAQIYSSLSGDTEGKLRRALANYITQGDALNKFFLFNEVNEELRKIDQTLPQKYGLVSAVSLVLNYKLPRMQFTRMFVNGAAVGSEEVIPSGDKYIIKVRGRNFVLLIHELVKGIGEYISMDVTSQEELNTEPLSDELKQFLAGPGLDNRLRRLIPADKIEYLPMVKKLFYRIPIPHIKEVLLGGGKAEDIIKKLIQTAEQQLKNHET